MKLIKKTVSCLLVAILFFATFSEGVYAENTQGIYGTVTAESYDDSKGTEDTGVLADGLDDDGADSSTDADKKTDSELLEDETLDGEELDDELSDEEELEAELLEDELLLGELEADEFDSEAEEYCEIDMSDYILQEGGLLPEEGDLENIPVEEIEEAPEVDDSSKKMYSEKELEIFGNVSASLFEASGAAEPDYFGAADTIADALINYKDSVNISSYNISAQNGAADLLKVWNLCLNSRPELFYVDSEISYSYTSTSTKKVVTVYFTYKYDKATTHEMTQEYADVICNFYESADLNWSDFEKILYINNYIPKNCDYVNGENAHKYDAYGCLVDERCVCQGYSLGALALARAIDLDMCLVTSNSLSHAWNLVKIDDETYHVDITWNDDDSNSRPKGYATFNYFLGSTDNYKNNGHLATLDWVCQGDWSYEEADDSQYYNSIIPLKNSTTGIEYLGDRWIVEKQDSNQLKIAAYTVAQLKSNEAATVTNTIDFATDCPKAALGQGNYHGNYFVACNDKIFYADNAQSEISFTQIAEEKLDVPTGKHIEGMYVRDNILYYYVGSSRVRAELEEKCLDLDTLSLSSAGAKIKVVINQNPETELGSGFNSFLSVKKAIESDINQNPGNTYTIQLQQDVNSGVQNPQLGHLLDYGDNASRVSLDLNGHKISLYKENPCQIFRLKSISNGNIENASNKVIRLNIFSLTDTDIKRNNIGADERKSVVAGVKICGSGATGESNGDGSNLSIILGECNTSKRAGISLPEMKIPTMGQQVIFGGENASSLPQNLSELWVGRGAEIYAPIVTEKLYMEGPLVSKEQGADGFGKYSYETYPCAAIMDSVQVVEKASICGKCRVGSFSGKVDLSGSNSNSYSLDIPLAYQTDVYTIAEGSFVMPKQFTVNKTQSAPTFRIHLPQSDGITTDFICASEIIYAAKVNQKLPFVELLADDISGDTNPVFDCGKKVGNFAGVHVAGGDQIDDTDIGKYVKVNIPKDSGIYYKNSAELYVCEGVTLYDKTTDTSLGDFANLKQAFAAIDKANSKYDEYTVTLNSDVINIISKEKENLSFPKKCKSLKIESGLIDNESHVVPAKLYYNTSLAINSDVTLQDIELVPTKNSSINLSKFALNLENVTIEDGKLTGISGSGVNGTSEINLTNTSLKVYGATNNVGEIKLLNGASFYGFGNINIGNIATEYDEEGEIPSLYGVLNVTRKSIKDKQTGVTTSEVTAIKPTITIAGDKELLKPIVVGFYEKNKDNNYDNLMPFFAADMDNYRASDNKNSKGKIDLIKAPKLSTEGFRIADGNLMIGESLAGVDKCYTTKLQQYIALKFENKAAAEVFLKYELESGEQRTIVCKTFADAVDEINNMKTKRDYTIELVKPATKEGADTSCVTVSEDILGTKAAAKLTFPKANCVNKLIICPGAQDNQGNSLDGSRGEIFFTSIANFTSDIVLKDIDFVYCTKDKYNADKTLRNLYLPASPAKNYADDYAVCNQLERINKFPDAIAINVSGYTMTPMGVVTFNTPIKLNGGGKNSSLIFEDGIIRTLVDSYMMPTAADVNRAIICGTVKNVGLIDNEGKILHISEYRTQSLSKGALVSKYYPAECNVTSIKIVNGGIALSGNDHKAVAKPNSVFAADTVHLAGEKSSQLQVEGKTNIKNLLNTATGAALVVSLMDFNITKSVKCEADTLTLKTTENSTDEKKMKPYLNISGSVDIKKGGNPIYVDVCNNYKGNVREAVNLQDKMVLLTTSKGTKAQFAPSNTNTVSGTNWYLKKERGAIYYRTTTDEDDVVKCSDITKNEEGWDFNPATNTLTLTDYNGISSYSLNDPYFDEENDAGASKKTVANLLFDGNLNLVLKGNNQLSDIDGERDGQMASEALQAASAGYGIYVTGTLTVSGDGTLTLDNQRSAIVAAKGMTIKSGTIYAYTEGESEVSKNRPAIRISNGDFKMTGGELDPSIPETSGEPLLDCRNATITGGEIWGQFSRYGINALSDVTVSGGKLYLETKSAAENSAPINTNNLTINNAKSEVNLKGSKGVIARNACNISLGDGKITSTECAIDSPKITWGSKMKIKAGRAEASAMIDTIYEPSAKYVEFSSNGRIIGDVDDALLYIGATKVTGTVKTATWSYDKSQKKLVLNGYNGSTSYTRQDISYGIFAKSPITIELVGSNTISGTDVAIRGFDNINITGTGSLALSDVSCGIVTPKDLKITNSTIAGTQNETVMPGIVFEENDFIQVGGTFSEQKATFDILSKNGIALHVGKLAALNTGEIKAAAISDSNAIKVEAGDVTISGTAKLDAYIPEAVADGTDCGIAINGALNITGGEVKAAGKKYGIATTALTVNGKQANLEATGESAIYASKKVTLTSGTMTLNGVGDSGKAIQFVGKTDADRQFVFKGRAVAGLSENLALFIDKYTGEKYLYASTVNTVEQGEDVHPIMFGNSEPDDRLSG